MSFRDKEKRRGPIDKRTTIDAVHNNKIKELVNEENSVNKLIKEQRKWEKEYSLKPVLTHYDSLKWDNFLHLH